MTLGVFNRLVYTFNFLLYGRRFNFLIQHNESNTHRNTVRQLTAPMFISVGYVANEAPHTTQATPVATLVADDYDVDGDSSDGISRFCGLCNLTFINHRLYEHHCAIFHPHVCVTCSRVFSSAVDLSRVCTTGVILIIMSVNLLKIQSTTLLSLTHLEPCRVPLQRALACSRPHLALRTTSNLESMA